MDDLTKLRSQYDSLHRELMDRQHVLNAYLKGKLPTQRELEEQNERISSHRYVDEGNTQWTSTPMRHPARSPYSHRNHPAEHMSRPDDQTPSKRKSDADTPRQIGRGSSLVHHGSESKRQRSMEKGLGLPRSHTKRAGSSMYHSSRKNSNHNVLDSRYRSPHRSAHMTGTSTDGTERHRESHHRSSHMTDLSTDGTERRRESDEENVAEESYVEQLLAQGNDRLAAARSREVSPNPRSILHTPGCRPKKTPMRVSFLNRLNRGHQNSPIQPLPRSLRDDSLSQGVSLQGSLHDRSYGNMTQPLLGYDWIAGVMDNNPALEEKSDDYLQGIKEFRQLNRNECVHTAVMDDSAADEMMNVSQGFGEVQEPYLQAKEHKCIHNYVLNDRLFAVPLHENNDGESLCAICEHRRSSEKKKSLSSPSYIRVSIPRSTLQSPYRVRPHRRQSFDPTDSMGLSQHCLAGWQNSRPSMMPSASTIDLKASLDRTMVAANSLFDPTLGGVQDTTAGRPLGPSRHTQELLNRSHALRVDLQRLERAGLSMGASHDVSRKYPLL
eukprot:XP_011663958.1 PREDICTED: uncharacterized protein LOC575588 isoform X3 [Strongylocentrotus purpuratus]